MHTLRNYLRSSFRNFRSNRLYCSLNVAGLAVCFTAVFLLFMLLYQETHFESFHANVDRIYRPTHKITGQNNFEVHFARIPVDYVNQLPEEFPEIETLIRFQNHEQKYFSVGEDRFRPTENYVTDSEVFQVFDFSLIEGDPSSALVDPYSVVLSQAAALQYFGRTDVVGEEIRVSGEWDPSEELYRVTGIMEDLPGNTHLPVRSLLSFPNHDARTGWAYVYLLLKEGADVAALQGGIPQFIERHTDPNSPMQIDFPLQSLSDIHLNSQLAREIIPNGSRQYLTIFLVVALFIWFVGLVNAANLGSAIALGRSKEMGVRNILGARSAQIFLYALYENTAVAFLAMGLASLLVVMFLPSFSALVGLVSLPPTALSLTFAVVVVLVSGLLVGIFPANMLARSSRGVTLTSSQRDFSWLGRFISSRRILITLQFGVAMVLTGSAWLAWQQMNYLDQKDLGLNDEEILVLPAVPDRVTEDYLTLKTRLQTLPNVMDVTACMQTPSSEIRDSGPLEMEGRDQEASPAPMVDAQIVDPDFIDLMDLELVAGTNTLAQNPLNEVPAFDQDYTVQEYLSQQPRQYLINERAMQALGYSDPDDVIGQRVRWSIGGFQLDYGPVMGVVKDFHQESLRNEVDPIVMLVEPLWLGNILVKIKTEDVQSTLGEIEAAWNDQFPFAFHYDFLDEMYNQLYKHDRAHFKLLTVLTLIALFVAFTGLVSLVAFTLRRRAKELSIRRVIGAELSSLTKYMSREYLIMIVIGSAVAAPPALYGMMRWLDNFAYHIDLSLMPYTWSVLVLLLITFLIVFIQTWQATKVNPTEYLRGD